MTSYFYMWEYRRKQLLSEHKFYVAEGKARITDQFSNSQKLKQEAEDRADNWLQEVSQHFDPERHDEGSFYDQANEEHILFYWALEELGNSARLALIAGMFHNWERSLKKWLTSNDGIDYWHRGNKLSEAIWKADFEKIFELFEHAGLFPATDSVRVTLNTCRLVVNTYKHGSGSSEADLKIIRPEFFDPCGLRIDEPEQQLPAYTDFEDLYVTSQHIDEFSGAIIKFWDAFPERITGIELSTVPDWFGKAMQKDNHKVGGQHDK